MNTDEIHYIVRNLFVGNKLERGDLELREGISSALKILKVRFWSLRRWVTTSRRPSRRSIGFPVFTTPWKISNDTDRSLYTSFTRISVI